MMIAQPWTPEQVEALNRWQACGHYHPFTCGHCRAVLRATPGGWECPQPGCDYRQFWAHDFMLREPPDWVGLLNREAEEG